MVERRDTVKVIKVGNSLAVRFPKKYFDVLGIKRNDKLDLKIDFGKGILDLKKKGTKIKL